MHRLLCAGRFLQKRVTKTDVLRHMYEGGDKVTDFREVYDLYFRDVYRYALSLCKDTYLAEEITQETFYKALSGLDQFDGRCKVSVWLCQIAKHTYISMCRKNKRLECHEKLDLATDEVDVEEQYAEKETASAIHRALRKLEEPYQEVFSLRTFGEMSFKQIALLFGKTEAWARVTYHRARLRIKEELK